MGDLSEHFSSHEFACKCKLIGGTKAKGYCGGEVRAAPELIEVLEKMRSDLTLDTGHAVRITITSGYRCPAYNRRVGGARNSQHCDGIAADIKVQYADGDHLSPADVADYLEDLYPDKYGIGRYPSWTHIDVRPNKARWGEN